MRRMIWFAILCVLSGFAWEKDVFTQRSQERKEKAKSDNAKHVKTGTIPKGSEHLSAVSFELSVFYRPNVSVRSFSLVSSS